MQNIVIIADILYIVNNRLISIIGPTAIGKTRLGIAVAKQFSAEIISADSRQFYKEMNIGTAVPSVEELSEVPHHFIQHQSIKNAYNVGHFEKDALALLDKLFSKNPLQVMVGGSGLYLDAVIKGLDKFPPIAPKIRERLNEVHREQGLGPLQRQLAQLDPQACLVIAMDNPHRVIRALEVCLGSQKAYSSFLDQPKEQRNFIPVKIGLTASREIIYQRIEQRVDMMMEQGLLDEVKNLYPQKHLPALNTVGYKELFAYLDGQYGLDAAIVEIKKNTRRFAKRQLTWFRKKPDIQWFSYDTPLKSITAYIQQNLVPQ